MIDKSGQIGEEMSGEFDLWMGRRDRLTAPLSMMRKCGLGPASYTVYEKQQ
jgi:hypothetical protein